MEKVINDLVIAGVVNALKMTVVLSALHQKLMNVLKLKDLTWILQHKETEYICNMHNTCIILCSITT